MTSIEGGVLGKTKPRPSVLHSFSTNGSAFEHAAEENQGTPEVEPSETSAPVEGKQEEWAPEGLLVKYGYVRSMVILQLASSFLPTSMVQNFPAMDAVKVFDVPVTGSGTPFFGP